MALNEANMHNWTLEQLRYYTFAPERTADQLAHMMRHWSSARRDLQAGWFIDRMLQNWVRLAPNPSLSAYVELFKLFRTDPDDLDSAQKDFNVFLADRYRSDHPPSPWWRSYHPTRNISVQWRGYDELEETGVLGFHGYSVGKSSPLKLADRRRRLDSIFTNALPPQPNATAVALYGPPMSEQRLHRMAHVIAVFRNAPRGRRTDEYQEAIADWDKDLAYLESTFHAGWFAFEWPSPLFACVG